MSFGLSEVDYALKRIYHKQPQMNIAAAPHPFFKMVNKPGDWTGDEHFKQGLEHGNPQGIGGDFAKAQAVSASTVGDAFDVTRRYKFGFAVIEGKAILATKNDEGAFFRAVKRETDNGIVAFGERLATEVATGDGSAAIGVRASISTNV